MLAALFSSAGAVLPVLLFCVITVFASLLCAIGAADATLDVPDRNPRRIALHQKAIIWLFLAQFAALFFPVAFLILAPLNMIFVYRLAKVLSLKHPFVWCAGAAAPLLGGIALFRLMSKATSALRADGIKVGLFGAKLSKLSA